MPPSRPDAEAPDPRVNRALRELFEREDRGEAVDRDAFLTGHADIADVLRSFLADAEELRRRVAAPPAGEVSTDRSLGETYRPASPGADGALSEVFGRYRVVRLLGKGAMGAVYLAEDTELSRRVALKVPAVGGDRPAELVERFRREARAAATLRSPNICPVFDVGEIGGRHYLSMAYIEGRTLAEVIRAEGPQPERRALLTARKLALALQEAHDHGVVHRDLKPGNVMVDGRGEPVVTDFGLASYAADGAARLTHSGVILGSPAYMSPEQLEGRPEKVTAAADQYALGVVLYEMLTGRLPFSGPVSAVIGKIVTQPAPSPRAVRPDLDPRVDALCLRMLAKSPAERFASTRAVAEALTAILKDPAGGAPAPGPATAAAGPADPPAGGPEPAETVPPAGGVRRQVAALVRDGDLRAALDLLEPLAARPPGKLSDWARQQQARLRERLDGHETSALCLVAAKLIRRHDYAEAKRILAAVPAGLRTEELSDLLREAEDKDEESGLLVGDIERAIRDGRADELPRLVKRLLQLKPGHSAARALAADLKKHGPEAVVRLRQGRRRPFDPAGPAWSRWHVAGFAGGLAAVCVAAYLWASVLHVPSTLPGVDDSPPSDERAVTPENDTAATAVTPAGTAAAGGWFDLLAAVDPAKAHPDLRLTRDGAFLTATRSDPADTGWVSLVSPREFAGDYDLELEYLLVGAKHVAVAFPVDETNVCATFTEAGSALHRIDGKEVDVRDVPPPHGNPDLAAREGVPHRVDVSVRHHGGDVAVETRLDGAAAGRFDGPASRLSDPFPKPRRLKVTTYFGEQTAGRRIELRKARVRLLEPSLPAPVVPADAIAFGGHAYKFFSEKRSWSDAKRRCEEMGGHLPFIEGGEENDFLLAFCMDRVPVSEKAAGTAIWIGASDAAREGDWRSPDGSPLPFTNWDDRQPNDKGAGEDFAVMLASGPRGGADHAGRWSDQPDVSTQHDVYFVCEWDSAGPGTAEGWVELSNGRDLAGWTSADAAWQVRDGAFAIDPSRITRHVRLRSADSYDDFELKLKCRLLNRGLLGLRLRQPADADRSNAGPLLQFGRYTPPGGGSTDVTGSLFAVLDGQPTDLATVPDDRRAALEPAVRDGRWLDVFVRCEGPRITAEIDGLRTVDYADAAGRLPRSGRLELYAPQYDKVAAEVRDVRVRRLTSPAAAPAAPAVTPPDDPANVIIDADFRTSDGGFARGDQDHILAAHENGEYRYLGKEPGWWFGGLHPALWTPESGRLKDFAAEFEVRIVGKKKGAIGLEFGHSGDDTLTLCLNQEGRLKLLRGSDRDVVPYAASPAMRPPGEFNTIRLAVEGETARVSVNGSLLFEKPLERYSAGAVNLWLNPEDVPFDTRLRRFRLERLGAAPPAPDRELRRLKGHADVVREVAFLPDGTRAVSVGHGGAFKLWDVATGELLHDFPGHPADATSVSVSADGRRALTGCDDGLVRLWDLEDKSVLRTLKGHAAPAISVRISRDGLTGLSAATDGSIRRWDLKPGGRSAVLPGPPLPSHLAVSPDERVVASGYDDGTVLLRHPEASGSLVGHGPSHIEGLAFTPDGTKLATGSGDGTVRVWDVSNGKELHRFESDGGGCNGVAVTADGRYLVAGFGDHSIVGWDLDTEDKVFEARADLPVTHRIALSPDGRFVLSGAGERLWKAAGDYDLRLWRLPAPPAPP